MLKRLFIKPRRLIGLGLLLAVPLVVVGEFFEELAAGRVVDPVQVSLEGLDEARLAGVSVFRIGPSGFPNPVGRPPGADRWTTKNVYVSRLQIDVPRDVWNDLTAIALSIGDRRTTLDRDQLQAEWSAGAQEGSNETLRLTSPPGFQAGSSRIGRFRAFINWPGDSVALGRLWAGRGATALAHAIPLALLGALCLFLPARPPAVLRSVHRGLRRLLRRPPGCPSRSAAAGALDLSKVCDVLGLLAVIAAVGFLEWQVPYYFVQDDALVTELPGTLVACRGLWEGRWPEWTPYNGLGTGLMSKGGFTYPPLYLGYAIARHIIGSEYATFDVFAFLQLAAGFWLCKRLCEKIGCSPVPATLAGLAFVLSGPILILGRGWHSFIPLAVWLPAIGLCLESLRQGCVGWRWMFVTALCLAMPVHVGFPQLAFACFGLFCLLVLASLMTRAIGWSQAFQGAAAVLCGLGLSVPILSLQAMHGKNVTLQASSSWPASGGLAAVFLPAPLVSAAPPFDSPRPDMTHLYFFGGVLALCWALGALLQVGGRFSAWKQSASLWWSSGLAFLLLAMGDAGGAWSAIRVLPLFSSLARHPIRMLPFFVFCATVSGCWIFDRLWNRLNGNTFARAALALVAFGLVGYHLTRVDTALTYYTFRPFPEIPRSCEERLRHPDEPQARRVCSLVERFNPRPEHGLSLGESLSGLYSIYSANVYDPFTEYSAEYRLAANRMSREKLAGLEAYGVGWLLVNREELAAAQAAESGSSSSADRSRLKVVLEPPWGKVLVSELPDTLAQYLGRAPTPGLDCGPATLFEVSGALPLAFRSEAPAAGLPFRAHTEGVDVDLAGGEAGDVVVNFLLLDWMTARVDGTPVPISADEWGRIVVAAPAGAARLVIRYEPPWKRVVTLGLAFFAAGLVVFFATRFAARPR